MTTSSTLKPAATIMAQEAEPHVSGGSEDVSRQVPSNRLAPYNPTHATAREKALDLLGLSNNDVLFDLGCGDGRLLFTAMERFYDDDYLLQQHKKMFNNVTTMQPPQDESVPSTDDFIVDEHEVKEVKFNNDITTNMRQSLDTQSLPLVPHLMCDASDDEEEESHGAPLDTPDKILSIALHTPQRSTASSMISPLMSPSLHAHQMPTTPTTSNRRSNKNDFRGVNLSPIHHGAIEEIQDVPLTITASSSNEEEVLNRERRDDVPTLVSSSSQTIGLRCVGIEYDQALVEAANNQIDSLTMFESFDNGDWLKKRFCIRWGCVFDEWNIPDVRRCVDGKMERLAQHLSLLEDATAVFVYLLPEGLKKVKPLLQEAARRRREQIMFNEKIIEQQLQEEQLQLTHRKDYSHVSDITDYDFYRTAQGIDAAAEKRITSCPPAFRVVSYMFSIPGWTPTKVDRSSKGGCPLYLYEKVTEEICE